MTSPVSTREEDNALLGTYSRNLPPLSESTGKTANIKRYILQSAARHILHENRRLDVCHRVSINIQGRVTIKYASGKNRAAYGDLMQCAQVWICPVCTGKIAEIRKRELHSAMAKARQLNLRPLLVTYTMRHGFDDTLRDLVTVLLRSYRQMTQNRPYRRTKEEFQIVGYIRALEITYFTGWHPHLHVLLLVVDPHPTREYDVSKISRELETLWLRELAKNGGDGLPGVACNVKSGDAYIADYINKYGHLPHEQKWSIERELTGAAAKRARGEEGSTAFALLEQYAFNGDELAADLFREYAAAMKGRSQLQWSVGLADMLDVKTESDDQIIDFEPPEYEPLLSLSWEAWRAILDAGKRGHVLDKVSEVGGDIAQVESFIWEIIASQQEQGQGQGQV